MALVLLKVSYENSTSVGVGAGLRSDVKSGCCAGIKARVFSLDYNPYNPLHNHIRSSFHVIVHFLFRFDSPLLRRILGISTI